MNLPCPFRSEMSQRTSWTLESREKRSESSRIFRFEWLLQVDATLVETDRITTKLADAAILG